MVVGYSGGGNIKITAVHASKAWTSNIMGTTNFGSIITRNKVFRSCWECICMRAIVYLTCKLWNQTEELSLNLSLCAYKLFFICNRNDYHPPSPYPKVVSSVNK